MIKQVITSSTEAKSVFTKFVRTSGATPVKVGNSRAKYYTLSQVTDWYKTNFNKALEQRWFGRALNQAMSEGANVSSTETTLADGRNVKVYRNSK